MSVVIFFVCFPIAFAFAVERELTLVKSSVVFHQIVSGYSIQVRTGMNSVFECLPLCAQDDHCQTSFFRQMDGFCQTNTVSFYNGSNWNFVEGTQYWETKYDSCPFEQGYVFNRASKLCYKFYFDELTWSSARTRCIEDGGDLIVFDTSAKHSHISETIDANPGLHEGDGYHIGATDEVVEGEWYWLNGVSLPLNSSLWADLPNNHHGIEHWARMSVWDKKLRDSKDSKELRFVCEINAELN